jgi:Fur family ferric uptake transcriptional regulator
VKAGDILNDHKLKRTGCREGIIEVVLDADEALSENEIREKLAGNYDRTTFYRSFKTLEKHRILHRIVVDNKMVKFAVGQTVAQKEGHAHFYCNHCQSVLCMDSVPIDHDLLPEGYSYDKAEVLIKGTCAVCKGQEN